MPWSTSTRGAQLPPGWSSRTAPRILARDGYQRTALMVDGTRCTATPSLKVDHIADRHDHRDTNLQTLCRWHHKQKTAAESAAVRRGRPAVSRLRTPGKHPVTSHSHASNMHPCGDLIV
ncbi:HNH endonuclease [Streptomyces sp. TRM66268-LWL]|uniref:HNH endonuclease n=1 Tax=Streptomyces polyasparticus TaxID=2767826 RepID=A0ABR7SYV3_9ACTN|nr:HNH endonuclease [Streptomyces polyasparticus]MBC9719817.1 HNH endonuclease [Streptomyces polyasparticus]